MAKNVRAGGAFVELGIKNSLDKGLKAASRDLKKWGTNISKIGATIGAAGSAIMGPMIGAAMNFQTVGDKYHKMSLRMATSSETLSQLAFAAEQSGTSIDSVAAAAFRADRRIANWANTASGPAKRALDLMGVSAEEFAGQDSIEKLMTMADLLGSIGDEAIRNQMGFEILGDNYRDLVPLLKEGSDGMRRLMEEGDKLGRTMTDEDAQAAADLGDAMNRLMSLMQGVVTQIGGALAPTLTDLANSFVDVGSKVVAFIRNNRETIVTVFKISAAVAGLGAIIATIGAGMIAFAGIVSGIGVVLGALLSPIGLVGIALGGLVAYGISQIDDFGAALVWLKERFGPLVETVQNAATIIFDALGSGDFVKAFWTAVDAMKSIFFDLTKEIRGYWESAMKWLVSITAQVVKKLGQAFQSLANFLRKMLDRYKNYYNDVWNFVVERIGEANGVRTMGGPIDAASSDPFIGAAESGIDKLEDLASGMVDFGDEFARSGQKGVDEFFRGMEREDKKRRDAMAKDADEIRKKQEGEGFKLPKLEDLLKQQQRTISATQRGAGTFSTIGAMFLGGQSVQERQLNAMEKVADNTAVIADAADNPVQARFA